mmetsp:Transcript_24260/g.72987  ORF Transcript_24260/g.72987 Transcript_24260/m.72987 type:complete len:425 (+) Transcript_24260:397-1671(+)
MAKPLATYATSRGCAISFSPSGNATRSSASTQVGMAASRSPNKRSGSAVSQPAACQSTTAPPPRSVRPGSPTSASLTSQRSQRKTAAAASRYFLPLQTSHLCWCFSSSRVGGFLENCGPLYLTAIVDSARPAARPQVAHGFAASASRGALSQSLQIAAAPPAEHTIALDPRARVCTPRGLAARDASGFSPSVCLAWCSSRAPSPRAAAACHASRTVAGASLASAASSSFVSRVTSARVSPSARARARFAGRDTASRSTTAASATAARFANGEASDGTESVTAWRVPTRENGKTRSRRGGDAVGASSGVAAGPSRRMRANSRGFILSKAAAGNFLTPDGLCASQTLTRNVTRCAGASPSASAAGAAWSARPSKTRWRPVLGRQSAPASISRGLMEPSNESGRLSKTAVGAPPSTRYVTVDSCGNT